MPSGWLRPSDDVVLRISTFRAPANRTDIPAELRDPPQLPWGRFRWVGRRFLDDPEGPEFLIVSLWDSRDEMEREVAAGQRRLSAELRMALGEMRVDLYRCRAYGTWQREEPPKLLRIFHGHLSGADPDSFGASAAAEYLANFESNPRCVSIAAAIGEERELLLASLWTNWDAVVSATGGDLRKVLPVQLPPWQPSGSATHYEVVAAEIG